MFPYQTCKENKVRGISMTRKLVSQKPCAICGAEMTDCLTEGMVDTWGISECKDKTCPGWKDAHQMIQEGSQVEEI